MRNIRNTITPALVLDKHMIPCRDENEKRLLYAYLSKKRELAEHLSQIIYVLKQVPSVEKKDASPISLYSKKVVSPILGIPAIKDEKIDIVL